MCQKQCSDATTWDWRSDGTIRTRSDISKCLLATPGSGSDSLVYVGACAGSADAGQWLNTTSPSTGYSYAGACVRLTWSRNIPREGICFTISANGNWSVVSALDGVMAQGPVSGDAVGAWHTMQLVADSGDNVQASLDGEVVANIASGASSSPHGMACLESGFNLAWFDNLRVE